MVKITKLVFAPLFTFLFLLPSVAQNKQLQVDISAFQIYYY